MLYKKMEHLSNWKILFLILQLVNTTSSTYDPIKVFTFDTLEQQKWSSLVLPERENTDFTFSYYCVPKSSDNQDESFMIGPKDENILEVALIESEQDIQCEAPVFLLRELNEESLENHKGYYSVYGFYINSETMKQYEKDKDEKEWLTRNYIPYTATRREIGEHVVSFVKLYESIDESNHSPIYYQYTIPKLTPTTHEKSSSAEADARKINCYPFKEVDFSDQALHLSMLQEYIDEIEIDSKKKPLIEFLKNNYLRPTQLVPTSHLVFEGHQYIRGNCSTSLIWESIYRDYLLKVDEAILNYAKKVEGNVTIRTGTVGQLITFNSRLLSLKYNEKMFDVPEIVWKMVSKVKRLSDESADPRETFFVVMIINNVFQNENQNFKLLENVILPTEPRSCERLGLKLGKELYAGGMISCSMRNDIYWKTKLNALNEQRFFDKRSPPVSPRAMNLPSRKVKLEKQEQIRDRGLGSTFQRFLP